jgi:hypothetical protein
VIAHVTDRIAARQADQQALFLTSIDGSDNIDIVLPASTTAGRIVGTIFMINDFGQSTNVHTVLSLLVVFSFRNIVMVQRTLWIGFEATCATRSQICSFRYLNAEVSNFRRAPSKQPEKSRWNADTRRVMGCDVSTPIFHCQKWHSLSALVIADYA